MAFVLTLLLVACAVAGVGLGYLGAVVGTSLCVSCSWAMCNRLCGVLATVGPPLLLCVGVVLGRGRVFRLSCGRLYWVWCKFMMGFWCLLWPVIIILRLLCWKNFLCRILRLCRFRVWMALRGLGFRVVRIALMAIVLLRMIMIWRTWVCLLMVLPW